MVKYPNVSIISKRGSESVANYFAESGTNKSYIKVHSQSKRLFLLDIKSSQELAEATLSRPIKQCLSSFITLCGRAILVSDRQVSCSQSLLNVCTFQKEKHFGSVNMGNTDVSFTLF